MEYPLGWTCDDTERQLEQYVLRTLDLAEAFALAEHVEACPLCAERLVLYRVTVQRTHA